MKSWTDMFKKKTTYVIFAFIILLGFLAHKTADAAETTFELAPGTMYVAGHRYNGGLLLIEERWSNKYVLAVGVTTSWDCADDCRRGDGPRNQFVMAQRVFEWKGIEAGFGISYWHNSTPAWNSHTPFALSVGYNFNDHLSVKVRHFSTAGSSTQNGGLDLLSVGWTF